MCSCLLHRGLSSSSLVLHGPTMRSAGRLSSRTITLLACAVLWHRVTPSAIGERQSQYQKDAANSIKDHSLAQENHTGEKVNENQSVLSENKSNNFIGAKDAGEYSNVDVNKKIFDDSRYAGGQVYNQDAGENVHGVAQKKGHKKGHHNTGFRNSYHKDESSNNSSYFDEYNDEADQSNYQNGRGRYGNEASKRYDNRKEDGIHHLQDNSRRGNYDRRGDSDSRNIDHQDYDRKRYLADRRDHNQSQRGQGYSGRDREFAHADAAPYNVHGYNSYPPRPHPDDYRRRYYDEPRPVNIPPPPPPPPHPLPPSGPHGELRRHDLESRRQTITIYEDPRLGGAYPEGGIVGPDPSGFVQLEVRPSHQRFQRYDNHYDPRRDWGVNRRSDINPLVFNYNRY